MAGAVSTTPGLLGVVRRSVVVALGLIAAGTLLRLVIAATTSGHAFDLGSWALVDQHLRDGAPLELYGPELHFAPLDVSRFPYPPGLLPVILLVSELARATGAAFEHLFRVPLIAADAAIAWLVFSGLSRAAGARIAIAGTATVALGPSFILNSAQHGQIDSLAVLPAVAAVVLWMREDVERRWLWCGLLVGLGATVKTPIGVLVLALLPTARNPREALATIAAAVVVPLAALAPFAIADPSGVREALAYGGLPGLGGLSLLAQPELAAGWLAGNATPASGLTDALQELSRPLLAVSLVAVTAVLVRRRAPAPVAAVVIVLTVWLAGVNYAMGYAIWGLPFLALAAWPGASAVLQGLLLAPTLMVEFLPAPDKWPAIAVYAIFVPAMVAVSAVWALGLRHLLRRTW